MVEKWLFQIYSEVKVNTEGIPARVPPLVALMRVRVERLTPF